MYVMCVPGGEVDANGSRDIATARGPAAGGETDTVGGGAKSDSKCEYDGGPSRRRASGTFK